MRRFLAAARGDRAPPDTLVGRVLDVGPITLRVESVAGEGGFSTIYRARDAATGTLCALKHVRVGGDPGVAPHAATEVATLTALSNCPSALRLRAAATAGGDPPSDAFLVLDLCGASLADAIVAAATPGGPGALPLATGLPAWRAAVAAVAAMHALTPPRAHRDVKAENVLQVLCAPGASPSPPSRWVLADYGSATARPTAPVGASAAAVADAEDDVRRHTTPAYRAPELVDLLARLPVGPPVDVWALGVLLHYVAAGRLPFDGDARLSILNGVRPPLPPAVPARVATTVDACLALDPRDRPTARELLATADELCAEVGVAAAEVEAVAPPPPLPPVVVAAPAPPPPVSPPAAAKPPVSTTPRRTRHRSGFASLDDDGGESVAAAAAAAAVAPPAAAPPPASPPPPPAASGTFWATPPAAPDPSARASPPPRLAVSPPRDATPTSRPAAAAADVESLRAQLEAALRDGAALRAAVAEKDARIAQLEKRVVAAAAAAAPPASSTGGWATFGDDDGAAAAPLSPDPWAAAEAAAVSSGGGARGHRRATSEPPPMEAWGL